MRANVGYTESVSQFVYIDLFSDGIKEVYRHQYRNYNCRYADKLMRKICQNYYCDIGHHIGNKQSHYAPEERRNQRYSVFIGYFKHTVVPELLTEKGLHKPAREILKRSAGNKRYKEYLKTVLSERTADKQQKQSSDTVYRNVRTFKKASVDRALMVKRFDSRLLKPACHTV